MKINQNWISPAAPVSNRINVTLISERKYGQNNNYAQYTLYLIENAMNTYKQLVTNAMLLYYEKIMTLCVIIIAGLIGLCWVEVDRPVDNALRGETKTSENVHITALQPAVNPQSNAIK
jgi:hypothetical protein